jgi:hypothetical protein
LIFKAMDLVAVSWEDRVKIEKKYSRAEHWKTLIFC